MLAVGIIGFGRIGAEHAGWLSRAEGIRAVATDDLTPARRHLAEQRGLRVHESIDAILDDAAIDVVLVSTPTAMHHEHATAALEAGKHVMVEKPMALDLQQATRLVELAERRQRVLSVFHNRRWDVDYLTVMSAIRAGTLGRVTNVESRIGQWASCVGPAAKEWHPTWRNEACFGGGGLYDWGSHFLDQLWRMMLPARPVRVFAQLRGNVWSTDCDDFARVCIDFDDDHGGGGGGESGDRGSHVAGGGGSGGGGGAGGGSGAGGGDAGGGSAGLGRGAAGMVEVNTTTTRPLPRWHLDGTLGSIDGPHSLAFDLATWSDLKFTPDEAKQTSSPIARAGGGLSETQIWERFAAAVRGEGEPAVTARSVLPTMALLDAARESARTGRAVELNGVEWIL